MSLAVPVMVSDWPTGTVAPAAGAVMADVGGVVSVVAAAATSPDCKVAGCAPMSARRLTVACLTAVSAEWHLSRRVVVVQSPRPLDAAGAEHQRAAGRAVQGQVVGAGAGRVVAAVVLKVAARVLGRGRQEDHARRAGSRCPGHRPTRSRGSRSRAWWWRRSQAGHRGVPPEPQLAEPPSAIMSRRAAVEREDRAGQRVLRTAAVGGWAEPRIAPGAGPLSDRGSILAFAWVSL